MTSPNIGKNKWLLSLSIPANICKSTWTWQGLIFFFYDYDRFYICEKLKQQQKDCHRYSCIQQLITAVYDHNNEICGYRNPAVWWLISV